MVRFPAKAENVSTGCGAHTASCSFGTAALSLEANRSRREVDLSPQSSTEVKDEWSCNSNPLTCLYVVNSNTLPLPLFPIIVYVHTCANHSGRAV